MSPLTTAAVLAACSLVAACRPATPPGPAAAQTASDDSNPAVERELAQMTRDWIDAVQKRDIATIDRILADDFVATLPDGRLMTKEQDIDELKTGAFTAESTTIDGVRCAASASEIGVMLQEPPSSTAWRSPCSYSAYIA